jgi:hypothetical protein
MTQYDMERAISDEFASEYGIRWETESVAKVFGDNNQSDKRAVNANAQIAVMTDVGLFRQAFGDEYIIGSSDGTSLRVSCQRIGRKFDGRNIPDNRREVINHILGVRAKGNTRQVRHGLPDSTWHVGTDQNAYIATYAAQLVDKGIPGDMALTIAKGMPW